MTREEAILILKTSLDCDKGKSKMFMIPIQQYITAQEMAIEALEENERLAKSLNEACELLRKKRPLGEWRDYSDEGFVECPFCEHATTCNDDIEELHYCFFCGAELRKSGKAE